MLQHVEAKNAVVLLLDVIIDHVESCDPLPAIRLKLDETLGHICALDSDSSGLQPISVPTRTGADLENTRATRQ
jgi:hypothetical protein